jgi:hypothetical protein
VIAGFTAFEVGNVATALLILRATDALTQRIGIHAATQIAIALYVYNIAAMITSFPAGGFSDKLGSRGPLLVTGAGVAAFLLAYGLFAISGPVIVFLGAAFALAGVGIGAAETVEHAAVAALAPDELRGSAFGLLTTVQALGTWQPAQSRDSSTPWRRRRWRSPTWRPGCSSRSPRSGGRPTPREAPLRVDDLDGSMPQDWQNTRASLASYRLEPAASRLVVAPGVLFGTDSRHRQPVIQAQGPCGRPWSSRDGWRHCPAPRVMRCFEPTCRHTAR